jgi:hypothetical protein
MTRRHAAGAVSALLLAVGIVAIPATIGWAQSQTVLPEKGGPITVVGCFTSGQIKSHVKPVLTNATMEAVNSVTEATCTGSGQPIKLQDLKQAGLDESMMGRWLEISGRLEGDHRSDAIREIHVKSFRVIPVVVPPVAAAPAPEPPPVAEAAPVAPYVAPTPAPEPAPVATTGEVRKVLPKSGTQLPLVGLIGFLSLAAGLTLHLFGGARLDRS